MEDVACIVRIYKSYIADNVTATINGINYYISFRSSDEIEFTIAFGSISAQVPDTIEITGLDQDVSANEVLDTTVSVNTNVATCEVQWTDKKSGETLTKAEYYAEPKMRLVVRPVEGYSFTSSPKLKINGTLVEASKLNDSQGTFLVYIKEFSQIVPPADKVIKEVGISGSDYGRENLVIGKAPVLDYTCLDDRVNFACWYEDDITGNKITKFAAGQQVRLKFEITPKDGYVFPYGEKVKVYVNGESVYVHGNSTFKKVIASVPYGVLEYDDIKSLNITDYTKPSPKHAPDKEFGLSDTNVASATFAWTDSNGNSVTKFEAGKTYTCTATFVGKSGHGFSAVANIQLMHKGIPYLTFDKNSYVLTEYNNKLVATVTYDIPADAAEEHTWDAATCTTPKTCKECGTTEGSKLGHSYTNACDTTCNRSGCGATRSITHDYAAATCTVAKKCKVCGTTSGSKLGHSYTNACDKTCNRSGCGATRSITHSYKTTTTKATLSKNGKVETKCSVCGNVSKTTTVYYPKTIKLSKTAYIYNGKVQTPSVTVKDSKGNTLKKDTDYTVKYSDGRKNTGKYTVTITFKGKYSGTKTLSYNILPSKTSKISITSATTSLKATWKKVTGATGYKVELLNSKGKAVKTVTTTKLTYTFKKLSKVTTYKVRVTAYKTIDKKAVYSTASTTVTTSTAPAAATLSKVTAGSKQATVAWKTVSGASGYEVQYSTSSKFKSAKTATVKKGTTAKTTIKSLTKGKTYYFKVRAYKTVDGAKVYGAWSAVKSAKIK